MNGNIETSTLHSELLSSVPHVPVFFQSWANKKDQSKHASLS